MPIITQTLGLVMMTYGQCAAEQSVGANALEQLQTFPQSIPFAVLNQCHVVLADGHHEQQGSHIVETLDPFPALRPLSAHVEHSDAQRVHLELGFHHANGAHPRLENVLGVGNVTIARDARNVLEETVINSTKMNGVTWTFLTLTASSTYYKAESLSSYSNPLVTASLTPLSAHKMVIILDSSSYSLHDSSK